jgi:hypothetical protein
MPLTMPSAARSALVAMVSALSAPKAVAACILRQIERIKDCTRLGFAVAWGSRQATTSA